MSAGIKGKDVELLQPCDKLLLRMALCIERLLAINEGSKPVHVGKVRHSAKGLVREANRRLRSKAAVAGIAEARAAVVNYRAKHPELYAMWEDEARNNDTRLDYIEWMESRLQHVMGEDKA